MLQGFAIIGVVIVAGYLVGRSGLLGPTAMSVWTRTVFFVVLPCLLFEVISTAEPTELLSPLVLVVALSALAVGALSVLVSASFLRRPLGAVVIGALSSGYVNSSNVGLPVAVYMLGSATWVAPIIVLQLVFFVPPAMVVLEQATRIGRRSVRSTLLALLRNPLLIASLLGTAVSLSGLSIPGAVLAPFELVGDAAVPLMLMGFGMSLVGQRILRPGSGRRDIALATVLKLLVMPVVAWLLGAFVFGLDENELHAAVVIAALPTAQNIANYAARYNVATTVARDTILLTTLGAVPVLIAVSLLLA